MVKKSENLKKNFFSKNPEIKKNIFFQQKKTSLFLNIRTTQFDQSSPVKPNPEKKIWKNLEKIAKKNLFFFSC